MAKNNKMSVYGFLTISVFLWAPLSDAWGYSEHLPVSLPNNGNWYIYGYISRLIWAMPFILLVVRGKYKGAILPKEIFGFHFHWKSFLIVLALSTIFVLYKMFFDHGGLWINPDFVFVLELFRFLVVGFVEELVYRGFGLNMLSGYSSARAANIISSLFFAAVHIPAYFIHWYCDGMFLLTEMMAQVISAFILGLILGMVFIKSKSIWPSVIIHFWYDFILVLFVG